MFSMYIEKSFKMVALLSGLPLVVSCLCGLVCAVLCAATQIQEQSLSYLVRLLAIVFIVWSCKEWFSFEMQAYISEMFKSFEHMGKLS